MWAEEGVAEFSNKVYVHRIIWHIVIKFLSASSYSRWVIDAHTNRNGSMSSSVEADEEYKDFVVSPLPPTACSIHNLPYNTLLPYE